MSDIFGYYSNTNARSEGKDQSVQARKALALTAYPEGLDS
jgi:hypothetical protein